MRYRRTLAALILGTIGLAGCGGTGGPTATPTTAGPAPTTGSTTNPPTTTPPTGGPSTGGPVTTNLAPNGLGPYVVGASLTDLQDRGLALDVEETPACPGIAVAKGTPGYHSPALVFFNAKLQYLTVTGPAVRTSQAVGVGSPVAQVQAKYPDALTLNDGQSAIGLLVKSGTNALLFRVDRGVVGSVDAGLAETVEFRFTDGEGC